MYTYLVDPTSGDMLKPCMKNENLACGSCSLKWLILRAVLWPDKISSYAWRTDELLHHTHSHYVFHYVYHETDDFDKNKIFKVFILVELKSIEKIRRLMKSIVSSANASILHRNAKIDAFPSEKLKKW